MRTIVDLPEPDLQAIKALARREKTSQAELLRRAVRLYLETCRQEEVDPQVFGIWQGRVDGLGYQQSLRDEWER
ncbi:MAG: CopG family transcriptional regulator [Candidatus Competibacteraceae bacterium]|nr:CopG family transcriptional regulator [Candidatus Competibacteraceae bacterium]